MKRYWEIKNGLKFFRIPFSGKERVNQKRRGIIDLGSVTASEMAERTSLNEAAGQLFCGKVNKAFPVIRKFVRSSDGECVMLVGRVSEEVLSGFRGIFSDWMLDQPQEKMMSGNGIMLVKNSEAVLLVKEYMKYWKEKSVILFLGAGFLLTEDMMNCLSGCRKYLILTEQLSADLKKPLISEDVMSRVQGIYIASAGSVPKTFQNIFPDYQAEKPQDSVTLSIHSGAPQPDYDPGHARNGKALILGQSREQQKRPVLEQSDLISLQQCGKIVIYNVRQLKLYTALLTR